MEGMEPIEQIRQEVKATSTVTRETKKLINRRAYALAWAHYLTYSAELLSKVRAGRVSPEQIDRWMP